MLIEKMHMRVLVVQALKTRKYSCQILKTLERKAKSFKYCEMLQKDFYSFEKIIRQESNNCPTL